MDNVAEITNDNFDDSMEEILDAMTALEDAIEKVNNQLNRFKNSQDKDCLVDASKQTRILINEAYNIQAIVEEIGFYNQND